jgi:hypothetical protein
VEVPVTLCRPAPMSIAFWLAQALSASRQTIRYLTGYPSHAARRAIGVS